VRRRFFVEKFAEGRAALVGEAAHHLGRVLRAQVGQLYELSDGDRLCLGRIEKVQHDTVEFTLVEELAARKQTLHITLLLAIVKFDAFEWILEKATELGVTAIVPLAAARSEKSLVQASMKRRERWQKILAEASQQSRRLSVPGLEAVVRAEQAFSSVPKDLKLLLSERQGAAPLGKALWGQGRGPAILAIGPEGGWTDAELEAAARHAFQQVSLGNLILRTETAVIAALASLNYALGE